MKPALKKLIMKGESSPFYQLLNMKIEEVQKDYARLSIEIDERHTQFLKTVHGGVIASLADSAVAWAIYGSNHLEDIPVTVEMKINFLKPMNFGKLVAEARNIHKGSKIFVGDVEVKDDKGGLIAKSLVTYYLLKRKTSVETKGMRNTSISRFRCLRPIVCSGNGFSKERANTRTSLATRILRMRSVPN